MTFSPWEAALLVITIGAIILVGEHLESRGDRRRRRRRRRGE